MLNEQQTHYVLALGYHWLTGLYDPVARYSTRERRFKTVLAAQANIRRPTTAGPRLRHRYAGHHGKTGESGGASERRQLNKLLFASSKDMPLHCPLPTLALMTFFERLR